VNLEITQIRQSLKINQKKLGNHADNEIYLEESKEEDGFIMIDKVGLDTLINNRPDRKHLSKNKYKAREKLKMFIIRRKRMRRLGGLLGKLGIIKKS